MSDPTPVFSAQEVGDFLDAIARPKLFNPPDWWTAWADEQSVKSWNAARRVFGSAADTIPAAPVIDVSPELAAVDTPAWLRPSPYPGGDWPPPPGFVS